MSSKNVTSSSYTAILKATLYTLLWMLCSSLLIILNRHLYVSGFPFPLTVTGVGQLISAVGGVLIAKAGFEPPMRSPPAMSVWIRWLLPLACATAATMCSGNAAYLYLSLSFVQILKAFTPAVTLVVCAVAGQERLTPLLVVSVALVAVGTGGAVLAEKRQVGESNAPTAAATAAAAAAADTARWWYGLLLFAISSVSEAARVVGAQALQGSLYRFSSAESLTYVGLPTAATLLLCALIFEGGAAVRTGFSLGLAAPPALHEAAAAVGAVFPSAPTFLAALLMSLFVNLTCLMAIKASSSLTFKVASCVKNVAVVAYGVLVTGDHVSAVQALGYAVSVLGFTLYSHLKLKLLAAHAAVRSVDAKQKAA